MKKWYGNSLKITKMIYEKNFSYLKMLTEMNYTKSNHIISIIAVLISVIATVVSLISFLPENPKRALVKNTDMGTNYSVPMSVIFYLLFFLVFFVFFQPFFLPFSCSGGGSVPSAFCRFSSASSIFISMISTLSFSSHSSRVWA